MIMMNMMIEVFIESSSNQPISSFFLIPNYYHDDYDEHDEHGHHDDRDFYDYQIIMIMMMITIAAFVRSSADQSMSTFSVNKKTRQSVTVSPTQDETLKMVMLILMIVIILILVAIIMVILLLIVMIMILMIDD